MPKDGVQNITWVKKCIVERLKKSIYRMHWTISGIYLQIQQDSEPNKLPISFHITQFFILGVTFEQLC